MILRKWEVRPLDKERAAAFAQTYGVPFFLAMLMNIRGLDDAAHLREFLGEGEPLSDPFLLKDMDKAAARITRAVDNMEKIAVYGDYDADGVTSTAMLYSYLETRGADVIFYIPQREGEGYGMNIGAVEYLKEQGVSLIVTVDNGISSVQEVARANELGIDVVVTDHHRPQEILPDAVAVVDAYRPDDTSPYKHFSGVGIAFKLLMALEDGAGDVEDLLEAYSDLAAIGTIGDIVPLTGENRTLIRAGLERLSQSDRPGVQALLENAGVAGKALTSTNVAFTLVPRINATGRMGAPERAVRLLISGYEEEAEVLSEEICADNEERRRVEAEIAEAAFADIEAITMNPMNPDGDANNWLSCMTIAPDCSVTPDQVMDALAEYNIETRPIWKPMHLQPVFADCDFIQVKEGRSVSEDIFNRGVCLPSDIKNTPEDMELIISLIRKVFGK